MSEQVFPTKGNLLAAKKSLSLARIGYELMDKKRNILIHELLSLVEQAKTLRANIDATYTEAYAALRTANIINGIIADIAEAMPADDSLKVSWRSVMGCELPKVTIGKTRPRLNYGFLYTDSYVDKAYICFENVKLMTAELAQIENSIYRLTNAIRKAQTRTNALSNVVIPKYERIVKYIGDALEEKEREEFSRLKVLKARGE
jgi:V/A-type H+-transporting ATPase subunit D